MKFSMNMIILIILLVNTCISLLYMLIMRILTKQNYVLLRGVIMLLCPVTAPLCYIWGSIQDIILKEKAVDYTNLSIDKTKKEFDKAIDKELELKTLPMEEVLTVSTTKDRREAMINLLKTDVSDRLSLVRKAVENEDSETAHYAAAALTDIFGKFTAELNQLQAEYDKDRTNLEKNEEFIEVVLRVLNSGALFGVEEMRYLYLYTGLVENLKTHHPQALTSEECAMMVKAYQQEGRSTEAEKWAEMSLEKWPDEEQSYMNVLYIKYTLGKREDFQRYLKQLTKSEIALSRNGLDIVRFWLGR